MNTKIIAEMACSHEGDAALAKAIITAAARARANIIQLQIWNAEKMMSPAREDFQLIKDLELSEDTWQELVDFSRENFPELEIYVCVYEHATIPFIERLGVDGYKINSSDLSNPLVLELVARTGKPVNLSVGASKIGEIQDAIDILNQFNSGKITLMYGHQSFPTKPENVHMSYMKKLSHLFNLDVGYQDHCDADHPSAYWLPAAALGLGVNVMEKHITHNRALKGIDHESALNPDEFIDFVDMIRVIDKALGSDLPRGLSAEEIRYRTFQKKSIVAGRKIKCGEILSEADILFLRAEELGEMPSSAEQLLGKQLNRDIDAYELIKRGDVL